MATLTELVVKLKSDVNQFNAGMSLAGQKTKQAVGNITSSLNKLAAGFTVISVASLGFAKSILDTTSNVELMRKRLEISTGSTEKAAVAYQKLSVYAKKATQTDLSGFIDAHNQMRRLYKGSEELIGSLAGISEEMGENFNPLARSAALALKGETRYLEQFSRQTGVSRKELEFLSDETLTATQKLTQFKAIIKEVGGANLDEMAKTSASKVGELKLEIQELTELIGKEMMPTFKGIIQSGIGFVKQFKEMDSSTKQLIAKTLLLTPAVTAAGAAFTMVASGIVSATAQLGLFFTTSTTGTAVVTGLTAKLGAVAVAIKAAEASLVAWSAAAGVALVAGFAIIKMGREIIRIHKEMDQAIKKEADSEKAAFEALKSYMDEKKREYMNVEQRVKAVEAVQIKIRNAERLGNTEKIRQLKELQAQIRVSVQEYKKEQKSKILGQAIEKAYLSTEKASIQEIKNKIQQKKRLLDLNQLDIAGKKRLVDLLNQQAAALKKQGVDEEKIHQIKVEAQNLNRQIIQEESDGFKKIGSGLSNITEARKEEGKVIKEKTQDLKEQKNIVEEAARVEFEGINKRLDIEKQLQDEINQIEMDKTDYKLLQLNKRVDEARRAGVDEVTVRKWVEAQKKKLIEDTTKTEKNEISKIKSALNSLKSSRLGGGNSPILGMRELSLSSQLLFAGANGRPESPAMNIAGGGTGIPGATNISNQSSESTVTNYNVQVGDVKLEGQKAKEVAQTMGRLAGINRSESVAISGASAFGGAI